MPGKTLVFHRLAAREYRAARRWYADRSPEAAASFQIAVDQALGRIPSQGDLLPRLGRVYRWVRVRRFPYVLVFREQSPDCIMVMAVAHTSRRPGYWRSRR